jgi:hypothetical protein
MKRIKKATQFYKSKSNRIIVGIINSELTLAKSLTSAITVEGSLHQHFLTRTFNNNNRDCDAML